MNTPSQIVKNADWRVVEGEVYTLYSTRAPCGTLVYSRVAPADRGRTDLLICCSLGELASGLSWDEAVTRAATDFNEEKAESDNPDEVWIDVPEGSVSRIDVLRV